ncbi:myosin light chain 5 [Platysternon megacephalum]|uniref:Myosin light chain 5 n=1 Tax=Platysternon megacephalum TaxID=55544 RepID=A0A4D9ESY3_9SAUR|nr:myosin light chain 5 [Platysternon megacephalum]
MESLLSQQRARGMESPGAAGQPFAAGLGAGDACVSFALSSPAHGRAVWEGEQMRRTVSYRGRVAVRYSGENNLRMPCPDKGTEFTKGQSLLPLGAGAIYPRLCHQCRLVSCMCGILTMS